MPEIAKISLALTAGARGVQCQKYHIQGTLLAVPTTRYEIMYSPSLTLCGLHEPQHNEAASCV